MVPTGIAVAAVVPRPHPADVVARTAPAAVAAGATDAIAVPRTKIEETLDDLLGRPRSSDTRAFANLAVSLAILLSSGSRCFRRASPSPADRRRQGARRPARPRGGAARSGRGGARADRCPL